MCVCLSLSLKTVLSPTEALSEAERQPRQIQTSNAPAVSQHTLGRPAGSASASPASPADGAVRVVSGGDVAARRGAAALPALTTHSLSLRAGFAHRMLRRYSRFRLDQLWKTGFLVLTTPQRNSFRRGNGTVGGPPCCRRPCRVRPCDVAADGLNENALGFGPFPVPPFVLYMLLFSLLGTLAG